MADLSHFLHGDYKEVNARAVGEKPFKWVCCAASVLDSLYWLVWKAPPAPCGGLTLLLVLDSPGACAQGLQRQGLWLASKQGCKGEGKALFAASFLLSSPPLATPVKGFPQTTCVNNKQID